MDPGYHDDWRKASRVIVKERFILLLIIIKFILFYFINIV